MAQALFDDHPLEQYLRAAGEPPETPPGSWPQAEEFASIDMDVEYEDVEESEWRPDIVIYIAELLDRMLERPQSTSLFAEHFKYGVISSTLLAASMPWSHPRRPSSPSPPGQLHLDAPPPPPSHEFPDIWRLSLVALFVACLLALRAHTSAALVIVSVSVRLYQRSDHTKLDMTSTTAALKELISASAVWDSIVQDTISVLEKEDESPPSPVSAIRLALHSSLQSTQTQCDNVRQLLSALTAPVELAQLSEMYAPPSPRTSLPPEPEVTSRRSKRTTWSGSYTSLSYSPSIQAIKSREKRRSDLASLFRASSFNKSHSAPSTPPPTLPPTEGETDADSSSGSPSRTTFGAAALELRRKRHMSGMDILRLQHTPPRSPLTGSSTVSHASRFTTMQTMRHPLALSSLNHAIDGALSAKRYACSYLLALRFDEEDDGYWEDVRSVMALLTTTFVDAAARLTEAHEDADHVANESESEADPFKLADAPNQSSGLASVGALSFAPMPSHLSRFAAHVDAISSALDDARDHLTECVAAVRSDAPPTRPIRRRRSRTFVKAMDTQPPEPPAALQAYERLRRELGLALRECERGRDRLLDIICPPAPPNPVESEEDMPALAHDASDEADESDKPDSGSPSMDEADSHADVVVAQGEPIDDPTAHLLLSVAPDEFPLPAAEQIFESQAAEVGPLHKERSKLTREERIKLAKAKRESGSSHGVIGLGLEGLEEKMPTGPGGDVVQELKDVIWKVGEKRRKLVDGQVHNVDPNLP